MNQQIMPLQLGQPFPETAIGFVGDPRQYRFNAGDGLFKFNDGTPVTKSKQPFTLIPLAFRLFHAKHLFKKSDARWVEMMFLNQLGNICHTIFHDYSVTNFLRAQVVLTYDGSDACDAAWTLLPIEKISKASGDKYYLLEFSHERLDEKTRQYLNSIRKDRALYREYTLHLDGVTEIASKHWHTLPDTPIAQDVMTKKQLEAIIEAENAVIEAATVAEMVPVAAQPEPVPAKKSRKKTIN